MRTYIALPVLLVFSVAFPARSQQQSQTASPATTPAPVAAQPDVDKAKDSTIVFFREGHLAGSALKPSIYLDGKEVNRLANGRWFSVRGAGQTRTSIQRQESTSNSDRNKSRRDHIRADGSCNWKLARRREDSTSRLR